MAGKSTSNEDERNLQRLEELTMERSNLAREAQFALERILSDRERIVKSQSDFIDSATKLAYFATEQAGIQAASPFNTWIEVEQNIIRTMERYAQVLNQVALINNAESLSYNEITKKSEDIYSDRTNLKKICDIAYYIWWSTGRNTALVWESWFRYKQDATLISEELIRRLASSTIGREIDMTYHSGQEAIPYEEFSPVKYLERVAELAYYMWDTSGRQFGPSLLASWAHAERHLSAATVAAFRDAESTVAATQNIAETLAHFSPQAHMQAIRERAYHIWTEAGHPEGRQLEHWLAAEEQYLQTHAVAVPHGPGGGPHDPQPSDRRQTGDREK